MVLTAHVKAAGQTQKLEMLHFSILAGLRRGKLRPAKFRPEIGGLGTGELRCLCVAPAPARYVSCFACRPRRTEVRSSGYRYYPLTAAKCRIDQIAAMLPNRVTPHPQYRCGMSY